MNRWRTAEELDAKQTQGYRFIARQPIFDRSLQTFGYELLFRSSWQNSFFGDAEKTSQLVVDNTLAFGMNSLVGKSAAFVNCTYALLVDDMVSLLPAGTVLEILETVQVDDALVAACKRLVARGYHLALDDYDFDLRWERLLPLADFIKVDFRASESKQRKELIAKHAHTGVQFLAEKVEDQEEFQMAMNEGFHLFQGYFFTRPVVVARPALASVVQRFRLLSELRVPELRTPRILELLKAEPSIALRVLRLANTAMVGPRGQIMDVRTALAMIGHERFRKLALGALMAELAGHQAVEMHKRILQRGKFCELMAGDMHGIPDELFYFGILFVIKPFLELTQEEIAAMLTLDQDLMAALAGTENRYQVLMRCFADFEHAEWAQFSNAIQALDLTERSVADCYRRSERWAGNIVCPALLAA